MKNAKFNLRTAGMAALMAASMLAVNAVPAMADPAKAPTENGKGIEALTTKQTFDSKDSTWVNNASATDSQGNALTFEGGKIKIVYDTTGGVWNDINKAQHDNGTYVVTIPTLIKYENMNIGTVNTSDDYTVNVAGAIANDKAVKLVAETGNNLAYSTRTDEITETTTQGKKLKADNLPDSAPAAEKLTKVVKDTDGTTDKTVDDGLKFSSAAVYGALVSVPKSGDASPKKE